MGKIEKNFKEYLKAIGLEEHKIPEKQLENIKEAFYAGCVSTFGFFTQDIAILEPGQAMETLTAFKAELTAYRNTIK